MCYFPKTTHWPFWPEDGTTLFFYPKRVTTSPLFSHSVWALLGPYRWRETKCVFTCSYECVFACVSSHMVHLELINSLTTDESLHAFSHMTSLIGLCHTVWPDNTKTFKAASNEIQKLYSKWETQSQSIWDTLDENRIESELASKGIKRKFITEWSPWRGDWWEQFCRAVKEPLCKVLREELLTSTELDTYLIKIEGVINSRPLTSVKEDHIDLSPITPQSCRS